MAVVKANYVKRGRGAKARAKATIRYMLHRPGRSGERVTRKLFGFDGVLDRMQTDRMIDEAGEGTIFFRIIISPDPKREDTLKDLDLWAITTQTMQALEERLQKELQWVGVEHDDHTEKRHIHTLVLVRGKLNRADFQALRSAATQAALLQRRERDLVRRHQLRQQQGLLTKPIVSGSARHQPWEPQPTPLITYKICFSCGELLMLSRKEAQRCSSCGARLSRQGSSVGYEEVQWS